MLNFAPNPELANVTSVDLVDGVLTLRLTGEISATGKISVAVVRRALSRNSFRHVHLVINSSGGNVKEAEAIYSALRDQPAPVSATAVDYCLSAAVNIYLAASLRLASPGTEFLLHQTHLPRDVLSALVTASDLQARADLLRASDLKFSQLLADRTGHPIDWYLNELQDEDVMDIAEAAEVGLVHGIDGENLKPNWAEQVSRLKSIGVFLPPRMTTVNYFAACNCAGSFSKGRSNAA